MGLLLRAVDVKDQHHWRWSLVDASDAPLADHPVSLDPAARGTRAFTDLHTYLRARVDHAQHTDGEAQLLELIGTWITQRVLGERVARAIAAAAPTTVRVELPPEAEFLLFRPLELAYVDGMPLARHTGLNLLYDLDSAQGPKQPVGSALRMVALFSQPTEATALALRRERHALSRLVRRLAAQAGRAIDLEVLQYGVTRQRVLAAMTIDGGPDVLHISTPAHSGLLLERTDGSTDPVATGDLLRLLAPARDRLKLAVVSASDSASAQLAGSLTALGLSKATLPATEPVAVEPPLPGRSPELGIAHRMARRLDCAVVAMRYPVTDEFAIRLAGQLYEGLFAHDLPLDRVLPQAVAVAAGRRPTLGVPAASVISPALFGRRAVGLPLTPPPGDPLPEPATVTMASFPPEPGRFVGRAQLMARASAALAPGSGHTGVLLDGVGGAGKTTAALELAYRHQQSFGGGLVFWQAPTSEHEHGGALAGLAEALEQQLGQAGPPMVDSTATLDRLREALPRLSRLLAEQRLLLVLDNLETLLTPQGRWRDQRWATLMATLTGHAGESRVILTSRIRPQQLAGALLAAPVPPLNRDESILLARELPRLRGLLPDLPGPDRRVDPDGATLLEVLELAQGHPKLLELADAAVSDRSRLSAQLAAARRAAREHGAALSAFFGQGSSRLDDAGFQAILSAWTTATVDTLPAPVRLLFQVLCLVEDGDRHSAVVTENWADLWRRLDRPGDPPEPAELLRALVDAALVDAAPAGTALAGVTRYVVHPCLAGIVRDRAPAAVRTAVDTELAAWWRAAAQRAREGDGDGRGGGEDAAAVVRAGLAAAPYLTRLQQWGAAGDLLEQALLRDGGPSTHHAVLPHLRRIADATGSVEDLGVLATALSRVDPAEAERLMRDSLQLALAAGDDRLAATLCGRLADLLRETGRPREALAVVDRQVGHTRRAGLGPWTRLGDRGRRLRLLHQLGEAEQVLSELTSLRAEMAQLSARPAPLGPVANGAGPASAGPAGAGPGQAARGDETVEPFQVHEALLDVGASAAADLGRWQIALDLTAELLDSMTRRGAADHDTVGARVRSCRPLRALGRLAEAEALLRECQAFYERQRDIPAVGRVLAARAAVARDAGRNAEAVGLARAALRLAYQQPDPAAVAGAHHDLAEYLAGADPGGQLAHRLAAAVLRRLTGMPAELADSLRALAADLAGPAAEPAKPVRNASTNAVDGAGAGAGAAGPFPMPATVAELAERVEQVAGVRFGALIDTLTDPAAADAALTELVHIVAPPAPPAVDLLTHLDEWEPIITAMVDATHGDRQAATGIEEALTELAAADDWTRLVGVLRRVLAGERDAGDLLTGLDTIDTAIVKSTLHRLRASR